MLAPPVASIVTGMWSFTATSLIRPAGWSYVRWVRRQRRWLVADEFQGINRGQAELVALLAGPDGHVAEVADDDELVHRWRGADPAHVAVFAKRYPRQRTIALARSFCGRGGSLRRLAACHNQRRVPNELAAVRSAGGQLQVRGSYE